MKYLRPIIDLLLYGNFWIAACAMAMVCQTQIIISGTIEFNYLVGLTGFATLMVYALHRIVGLNKVQAFTDRGRYYVIEKFKRHILFYAAIGAIGAIICFFLLSIKVQLFLILPGLISLGYVIPFLAGKKRLRDLNHIKIYLVALVWAWISVALPMINNDMLLENLSFFLLLFMERSLFIFAITLPFDIRDLQIDKHTSVLTIPSKIGAKKSKRLAYFLLSVAFLLIVINCKLGNYEPQQVFALGISFLITVVLIFQSSKTKEDYFFTGLIDGMMILQFILIYLFK